MKPSLLSRPPLLTISASIVAAVLIFGSIAAGIANAQTTTTTQVVPVTTSTP